MSRWKNRIPYLCADLGIVLYWTVLFARYLTTRFASGAVFYGCDKVSLAVQLLTLPVLLALVGFRWDKEPITERFRRRPALLLTGLMIVTAFFIFHPYITASRFLVFQDIGGDTTQQYLPVLNMVVAKLKAGDWSWWTATWGPGIDIVNNQSLTFDLFNLPLYFLGVFVSNQVMLYGICLVQIAKCLLCGYFTYLFLSQFSFSPWAKVIASYICAFCGFILLWGQHYFFASGCVALMLILWLLERSFRKAKTYPFLTLALAVTAAFSLYVTYMIALFCLLYGVVRLISLYPQNGRKKTGRILLQFVLSIVSAALLSAALTLPAYYQLTAVSRRTDVSVLQNLRDSLTLFEKAKYKAIFLRFFSNNLSGYAGVYAGTDNYYEMLQIFFSCLCPAFLTIFFSEGILYAGKLKKRLLYLLLLAVFVFSFALPFTGLVFNKFVMFSFRYSFVYIPFMAFVIARTLSRIRTVHPVSLGIAWAVTLLSVVLILKKSAVLPMGYVSITAALVVAGTAALTFARGWKRNDFVSMAAVCLIAAMSVSADGYVTTSIRGAWKRDSNLLQNRYSDTTAEALAAVKTDTDGFYRIEKAYADLTPWNDPMAQNYTGVSYYNTTYNRYVQDFIRECWPDSRLGPEFGSVYVSAYRGLANTQILSLLGVRYVLSNNRILDGVSGYTLCWDGERGISAYKNNAAGGLGILFDRQISESDFLALSAEDRQKALADCVVTDKTAGDIAAYQSGDPLTGAYDYAGNAVSFAENGSSGSLSADVSVDSEKLLFLSIPYDAGWTVTVNGEKAQVYKADLGFQAVVLQPGENRIDCTYRTPMLKAGLAASAAGVVFFVFLVCLPVKKRRFADLETAASR